MATRLLAYLMFTAILPSMADIRTGTGAPMSSPVDSRISGTATNADKTVTTKPKGPRVSAPTSRKGPQVSVPTKRGSLPEPGTIPKKMPRPTPNAKVKIPPPPPSVVPRAGSPKSPGTYPWRLNITATVFWVGEDASARNPVHNHMSSWDANWRDNFGGFDNPDPLQRTSDYRPKAFIPRQNPFYIALPYNDVSRGHHKPEASRVIPWFKRDFTADGESVCKGKWVQIIYNGRSCFAQWEDCGPFTTEDWPYVFGDKPPVNTENKGAGIDISPSVRDYLGIKGGTALVHWRFVEVYRIPYGPWSKWGDNNHFVHPELKRKSLMQLRKAQDDKLRRQQEAIQRKLLKDPAKLRRELYNR